MNDANLHQLLNNYLAKFDEIYNEENNEGYKWEAVAHFQKYWDIDSPEFGNMFKEAVSKTSNLVNNRIVQPTGGIVELCKHEPDTVRGIFEELLEDDGGDIDARQNRIQAFVTQANELLDKYANGKWKYSQDMRTVIFYLCLIRPDENYIYKATQAKTFAECVEFGEDFGSGQTFSLKNYYKMCDDLVEAIKATPELVERHAARLDKNTYPDKSYHILAYDIIYSGIYYNLYHNIEIKKPARKHSAEQARISKMAELQQQQDEAQRHLNDLLNRKTEYDDVSAKNLLVTHKIFGTGRVLEQDGNIITVHFANEDKKFTLPNAFSAGYLTTEETDTVDIFTDIAALDDEIYKAKSQMHSISNAIRKVGV